MHLSRALSVASVAFFLITSTMSVFVLAQFVRRLSRLVREQPFFFFGFVLKPQSCEPQASVRLDFSKKKFKDFVGLANGRREERRPQLTVLSSRYQSGERRGK